jgi:hypothetical protein
MLEILVLAMKEFTVALASPKEELLPMTVTKAENEVRWFPVIELQEIIIIK